MLTKQDLQKKFYSNTVIDRIITELYKNDSVMKIDDLTEKLNMQRKNILLHCRKSPYLYYDKENEFVKLDRRGKDIHKFGKLYNVPHNAENVHDFVFSVCYLRENKIQYNEALELVENFCRSRNKFIGQFARNRNIFHTIKKEVKYWL